MTPARDSRWPLLAPVALASFVILGLLAFVVYIAFARMENGLVVEPFSFVNFTHLLGDDLAAGAAGLVGQNIEDFGLKDVSPRNAQVGRRCPFWRLLDHPRNAEHIPVSGADTDDPIHVQTVLRHLLDCDDIGLVIEAAGGVAKEFHTIAVDDGIAMGHDGMLYSLPSRDVIADSVEYMVNAHCADALVCISNCDKITPGMLMAAMQIGRAHV